MSSSSDLTLASMSIVACRSQPPFGSISQTNTLKSLMKSKPEAVLGELDHPCSARLDVVGEDVLADPHQPVDHAADDDSGVVDVHGCRTRRPVIDCNELGGAPLHPGVRW
ncbi:hypothetical protein EJB05_03415, partial [Eragrostis curvula]